MNEVNKGLKDLPEGSNKTENTDYENMAKNDVMNNENSELVNYDRAERISKEEAAVKRNDPREENENMNVNDELEELKEEIRGLRSSYEKKINDLSSELQRTKEERIEETGNLKREIKVNDFHTRIRSVAYKQGFVEPEETVMYLKDKVEISDHGIKVDGRKISDDEIDNYIIRSIKALSDSKPHLVRSTWKSGSDAVSSDAQVHSFKTRRDFSNPAVRRDYEEELRMLGLPLINPIK